MIIMVGQLQPKSAMRNTLRRIKKTNFKHNDKIKKTNKNIPSKVKYILLNNNKFYIA